MARKHKEETKLMKKRFQELEDRIKIKQKLKAEMRSRLHSKYPAMTFSDII